MIYRLYIYRSTAATGSAAAVRSVNTVIGTNSEDEWKRKRSENFMDHFNAAEIKKLIESELGDKCKVMICYTPRKDKQKEYLFIATSYARIRDVLPRVHAIAMENRLALYDAETERSFFKSLFDDTFINMRLREQELKYCILEDMNPVWRIRKILDNRDERDKSLYYCVTLRKDFKKSFKERVAEFYNCLNDNLAEGESLTCENRSFTISREWYSITFILEGYKKHANMIGYFENGNAQQDLIRRMGVEDAFKWMDGCDDTEKVDILKRLNFKEMEDRFPNLADRFVGSIRITKWQRKQVFDVRYSGFGYYGSEILFHIVPDVFYQDANRISVLKIEEESATFILPFIHEVYPYFYQRYYLTENHLPTEMWADVVKRIRTAQKMVVHDTYNPELKKYIEFFNLFVLADDYEPRLWKNEAAYDPVGFVYEHRYEIAYLYEIFIQWSETQLYYYHNTADERMFNIQGP